jgi:Resolvase, N terminal domain/Recombinase zinc beta ribbon domain
MDRVRDLVATGSVSRWSWHRTGTALPGSRPTSTCSGASSRSMAAELRSLNDRSDDTPEGELTDGILDQIAKYERTKIAERSRRGKLHKAREGKVLAGRRIKYGFKLNAARDGLEVDEEKMAVVRRIFRMVGVEGLSQRQAYLALTREGIPTAIRDNSAPSSAGRRFWQLSGGIARCGVCANGMMNRVIIASGKPYFYHSCRAHQKLGDTGCTHRKNHPVEGVEAEVWQFVSGLLRDPQRLREGLDRMVECERAGMHGDPEQEQKHWLEKLAEAERRRSGFQDMWPPKISSPSMS